MGQLSMLYCLAYDDNFLELSEYRVLLLLKYCDMKDWEGN